MDRPYNSSFKKSSEPSKFKSTSNFKRFGDKAYKGSSNLSSKDPNVSQIIANADIWATSPGGGKRAQSTGFGSMPNFNRSERRFNSNNYPVERKERQVTDVRQIYQGEVALGRMIELEVSEITEQGAFVNAKEHGALFVPRSQLPDNLEVGSLLRVFLYKDGQRTLATARHPYIELGMTGRLKVNSIENGTAYLDLGIPKELVVPVSEQRTRFRVGAEVVVLVAIDELGRLFGTQCFNRYIKDKAEPGDFEQNEKVKVVATETTPLGYRVIVNDRIYGLIFNSEQKGEIIFGKRYDGFVKNVRKDGRLDISLQEGGLDGINHAAFDILQALHFSNGKLNFSDKSDPQDIEDYLHMSKGKFKKAIGSLYKAHFIEIHEDHISLTPEGVEKIKTLKFRGQN